MDRIILKNVTMKSTHCAKCAAAAALVLTLLSAVLPVAAQTTGRSWAADNGNGTYSNPLFYDEFSDPDMIRVGADYYLTGTTMHTMPGLPILQSKDLVNWTLLGYAFAFDVFVKLHFFINHTLRGNFDNAVGNGFN